MREQLGHYRILERIGAGGMGEVYRARDTRLGRDVAVKMLPAHVAESAVLRQRFDREARALACLSHPNICALYDVGRDSGVDFLVMEYLEGESLASRLGRGPLAFDVALRVAAEIAAALDAAHRRGIVHRDLKPGNIVLTRNAAKLLDFGLAKEPASLVQGAPLLSSTPTRSEPLTAEGAILGTLDYMAPEQLEGREADARSDIFSFGAILYEMVTGRPAFSGQSQASLISAILTAEPAPISQQRPATPPALEQTVARCLAKDPDERWQSARDLMFQIKAIAPEGPASSTTSPAPAKQIERWVWAAVVLGLAAGLAFAMLALTRRPESSGRNSLFSISLPGNAVSLYSRVSPDGSIISHTARSGDQSRLWVRPLDSLSARPLAGTEGARAHFWSPDSRSIAFFAGGKLKKIDVAGGSPTEICDAPGSGPFQLGAWGRDGTILFHIGEAPGQEEGLFRIPRGGGKATRLDIRDDSGEPIQVAWPSFLPDSRHIVAPCQFDPKGNPQKVATCLVSLETLRASILMETSSYALPAMPGYLLYVRGASLFAQPFDFERLRLSGEPSLLAEHLEQWIGLGAPKFSVSDNGVLVYQMLEGESSLNWKDRRGVEVGQVGSPAVYSSLRLSPEGTRVVASITDTQTGSNHLWMIDLDRDVSTRLDPEDSDSYYPLFSPDGTRLFYCKAVQAPPFLHARTLAGGEDVLLPSTGTMQCPTDLSPDGRSLLFDDRNPTSGWDIWVLSLEGERRAVPLIRTPHSDGDAVFSPDGRWIAYVSDETGRYEVYARPFRDAGEKVRISTDGGSLPRWRRDGKELFYLSSDNHMMAVPVSSGNTLDPAAPVALFLLGTESAEGNVYEVSPDGQRFLVSSAAHESAGTTVMVNWTARLTKH